MAKWEEHEKADRALKSLNFTHINFPSDQISIRSLRRLYPQWFDHGFASGDDDRQPQYFLRENTVDLVVDDLGLMTFRERLVVAAAFAAARGLIWPSGWDIEDAKQELIASYCQHGLAEGPHAAALLVQELEREGTSLAPQFRR